MLGVYQLYMKYAYNKETGTRSEAFWYISKAFSK